MRILISLRTFTVSNYNSIKIKIMVSKKLIKAYDFKVIEEYFQYILDSRTNGQNTQCVTLYKQLSDTQKNDFAMWYKETHEVSTFLDLITFIKNY